MLRPTVLFMFGLLTLGGKAQVVDLAVHGFRSDVTVPISDLTRLSLEYSRLYREQASDLDFSARVSNLSSDTALNVLVSVEVFQNGLSQGLFSSDTLPELLPGASDTVAIDADLYAQSLEDLDLVFEVFSDDEDTNATNDLDTLGMKVDEWWSTRWESDWNDTVRCPLYERIAARYEFVDHGTIFGIRFVVPEQTGLVFNYVIAQILDDEFNELVYGETSLLPSDFSEPGQSNWITVFFSDLVEMPAGTDCYAAIWSLDSMMAIAAGSPCADSSVFQVSENGDSIVELDKLPLIGLVTMTTGLAEQAESVISIGSFAPNPAETTTRISYTTRVGGFRQVEVTRTDGVQVRSIDLGRATAGPHSYELDVSRLPPGMYACTVLLNGQRATRRFVVVH